MLTDQTLTQASDLPEHAAPYGTYDKVKAPLTRHCLLKIARLFLHMDKIFAALFRDVLQSHSQSELLDLLGKIRKDISRRQGKNADSSSDQENVFLGDLGHYCEDLHHQQAERTQQPNPNNDSRPRFTFRATHTNDKSLFVYLQDGLEVPYWKLMLDVFFESRANESLIGGDVLSLSLSACKTAARLMRRQLERVVERLDDDEAIDAILRGIDKRIETLDAFTDGNLSNLEADDGLFELVLPNSANQIVLVLPSETNAETQSAAGETSKVCTF